MIVLGIETSCDETGVAVVEDQRIRSNVITSQIDLHARFGGVVPELASRAHVMTINPAIEQALTDAGVGFRDLDGVAATVGPGLIGALLVGVAAAKATAAALDVPLIGVNHLEGHIESAFLQEPDLEPPVIALIVSGGHTMIARMPEHGRFEILGQTIDDAAGEAFDKVARFLGLGFPGGPAIDRLARDGDAAAYRFPRALLNDPNYDFSLSGLKTAVIRWAREREATGEEFDVADVAASFQEAIVDVQVAKTVRAALDEEIGSVVIAGGVAANSRLRDKMREAGEQAGLRVVTPAPALCTDNGAMIAAAGARRLARGEVTPLNVGADPSLSLA
ncbi:MAG TPA: tRNA (adenosine(37)-N6)-threonylcarbamoyltransferase complex transferase subunit TsaD [Actinomycetota bacterium]|nr:tRNA (adenosine(37)-N6)-threonylcarbamoyltransferase complex transferase subunit TsaD [Actinomycetota bacterium]